MKIRKVLYFITISSLVATSIFSCSSGEKEFDTEKYLDFALVQVQKSVEAQKDFTAIPRQIPSGETGWHTVGIGDWTSGFWPGIIWYMYEYSGDDFWRQAAIERNLPLKDIISREYKDHDLGFQYYCSFGNGLRLAGEEGYKEILLQAADTLAAMFNPVVGTILSWPFAHSRYATPHNTIIDNLMNLELLFWAAKNGGNPELYDVAVAHAKTTMQNHLRPDYSSYHVLAYDTITGEAVQKVTHQGYSDESMWARGQAWGIYGFVIAYRETGLPEFLETTKGMADIFIERLPEDHVPFWDFDSPDIPNTDKDASAGAIAASALLELSTLIDDPAESAHYRTSAVNTLRSLSENYLSDGSNHALLNHCVGHRPRNSEVDVSIIYAEYYYIEALMKERKLQQSEK